MEKTIIGIAGRKGAGKDTAAQVLLERGAYNAKFAAGIKVMLRAYLSYVGVQSETIERMIDGDLKEVPNAHLGGHTPRYAMQTLGTEWGRDIMSKTFWIDSLRSHVRDKPFVVVTDVRFPNEVNTIRELGGHTVLVFDPDRKSSEDDHPSELAVDLLLTDYLVENSKSVPPDIHLHPTIGTIASNHGAPL